MTVLKQIIRSVLIGGFVLFVAWWDNWTLHQSLVMVTLGTINSTLFAIEEHTRKQP